MNQTFKLSLKPDDYPPRVPVVYANQYDVGRPFQATILDVDDSEYTFTNETVAICGTKPDGTGFSYDVTASGHVVTFTTTGQMTVVHGFVRCGIIITQGSTVIGTLAFLMYVQPAALQTGTIISSDDFGSIITDAVADWMDEHGVVIDNTLSVAGAAADAEKTGDEIADLKSAIDYGSITVGVKDALIACFNHVAWDNDDPTGQTYIDALYDALYNRYWQVTSTLSHCTSSNGAEQTIKGNPYTATITASAGYVMTGATVSITMGGTDITATAYSNGTISIPAVTGALVITITAVAAAVSSISAAFTQGEITVWSDDSLDSLKQYLVVTATLEDSTTFTVPSADYTLSGSLSTASSTITVTYQSKTDAFTVAVTVVGDTNYSDSLSNWVLSGVGTSYASNVIQLKSTQTNANAYKIWTFDRAKTLWSAVSGKKLRVRISVGSPDWSGDGSWSSPLNYVAIGVCIFKNSTITSGNDRQKYQSLYSDTITADPMNLEYVFDADVANMSAGSGTPTSSSTFGIMLYNNSANTVKVYSAEIVEVLS